MTESYEKRHRSRSPVVLDARCRTDRGIRDFVVLVDLTTDGCCIMSKRPLLIQGQTVNLQPETLAGFRAQAVWTQDCLAGLKFEIPLHRAVYEHMVRTFPSTIDWSGFGDAVTENRQNLLSLPVRRQLLNRIHQAELENSAREHAPSQPYARIQKLAYRTGIKVQSTSEKILQLYLG
ncbi:hypothetical protein KRR38_32825 [Novosphingobium sp. G106]|uniref:hypothetical protein n=1 Tax=Novosphingobium sp. G106 TaxID=2849500 RepID=UPI001C2CF9D8|nr:hypothetical protein [Novosphingobium sp. G106]MBV1692315.1 hypothetical protein [Novosphingobium sp. G106]